MPERWANLVEMMQAVCAGIALGRNIVVGGDREERREKETSKRRRSC